MKKERNGGNKMDIMDVEEVCRNKGGVWNANKDECIIRERGKKTFTRKEVWKVLSEVEGGIIETLPRVVEFGGIKEKISVYFENFEL